VGRRFLRLTVITLLGITVVLAFLVPLPERNVLGNTIQNALHTLAFALFTFVLDCYLTRQRKSSSDTQSDTPAISSTLLRVTFALVALALLSELVQPLTGRSFSIVDILRNFLGISIGHITFILFKQSPVLKKWRIPLMGLLAILTLLGINQPLWFWYLSTTKPTWPVLADFEHTRSLTYVRKLGGVSVTRVNAPTTWLENKSSVVEIEKDTRRYSGFSLFDFEQDWRSMTYFEFDVFNPENELVVLNVRINDTHHNNQYFDRFNQSIDVAPGASRITIPLATVLHFSESREDGRAMDLSSINKIVLFMTLDYIGKKLYLDNIQLR